MDRLTLPINEKSDCQSCYDVFETLRNGKVENTSNNELNISQSDIESFKRCLPLKKDCITYNDSSSRHLNNKTTTFNIPKEEKFNISRDNNLQVNKNEFCGESKNNSFLRNNDNDCNQSFTKLNYTFNEFKNNSNNEKSSNILYNDNLSKKTYNVNVERLPTIEEIKCAVQDPKSDIKFTFYELFAKLHENNENNVQNIIYECIKNALCQDITKIIMYFLDDTYGIDTNEFENTTGFSFNDIINWGIDNDYFIKLDNLKISLKNKKINFENDNLGKNNLSDKDRNEVKQNEFFASTSEYSFENESKGKIIILYVLYMGLPKKIYSTTELKRNIFEFCGESFDENFCKKHFNNSSIEDVCKEYFGNVIELKIENDSSCFVLNKVEEELWEIFCANVEKYVVITGKKIDVLSIKKIQRKTNIIKNISGIWIPNGLKFSDLF